MSEPRSDAMSKHEDPETESRASIDGGGSDVSQTTSQLMLAAMTLFEKYGGMPTMKIVVRNFCTEILSRPNLARYYEGMDLEGLITHQINLVAHLIGYSGFSDEQLNNLRRHHHHLGITKHSYGKVAEILREELIAAKFEHADVEIVINTIYEHLKDIVTRR